MDQRTPRQGGGSSAGLVGKTKRPNGCKSKKLWQEMERTSAGTNATEHRAVVGHSEWHQACSVQQRRNLQVEERRDKQNLLVKKRRHHRSSLEGHQLASFQNGPQGFATRNQALPCQTRHKTLRSGENDEAEETMEPQHVPTMWRPRGNHCPCEPVSSREVPGSVGGVHGQTARRSGGPGHRTRLAATADGSSAGLALRSSTASPAFPTGTGSSIDSTGRHRVAQLPAGKGGTPFEKLQQKHFTDKDSKQTGKRWTTEIIKKLIQVAWDMWDHRNDILHNDGGNFHKKWKGQRRMS